MVSDAIGVAPKRVAWFGSRVFFCLPVWQLPRAAAGVVRLLTLSWQPKRVDEIKEFLLIARRKDVQQVKVKKSSGKGKKGVTKFKVRCSKYVTGGMCCEELFLTQHFFFSLLPGTCTRCGLMSRRRPRSCASPCRRQ
jgi:hypothetical protein